jgi:hypothetical protein
MTANAFFYRLFCIGKLFLMTSWFGYFHDSTVYQAVCRVYPQINAGSGKT